MLGNSDPQTFSSSRSRQEAARHLARAGRGNETSVSMSAIVLVLDNGVDAVVWGPEELESIVAAICAGFRQYVQNIKQDTA